MYYIFKCVWNGVQQYTDSIPPKWSNMFFFNWSHDHNDAQPSNSGCPGFGQTHRDTSCDAWYESQWTHWPSAEKSCFFPRKSSNETSCEGTYIIIHPILITTVSVFSCHSFASWKFQRGMSIKCLWDLFAMNSSEIWTGVAWDTCQKKTVDTGFSKDFGSRTLMAIWEIPCKIWAALPQMCKWRRAAIACWAPSPKGCHLGCQG